MYKFLCKVLKICARHKPLRLVAHGCLGVATWLALLYVVIRCGWHSGVRAYCDIVCRDYPSLPNVESIHPETKP